MRTVGSTDSNELSYSLDSFLNILYVNINAYGLILKISNFVKWNRYCTMQNIPNNFKYIIINSCKITTSIYSYYITFLIYIFSKFEIKS